MYSAEELIAFEKDIADLFNAGKIRAPIHLDGGNEAQLIDVFKNVKFGDWVCGSWRMHYKCLLKGVPRDTLKSAILAGRSITLCFPEYRVVSSAIVGGILPIALGLAWAIRRSGGGERVWCFLGDMTALTGIYRECEQYSIGHNLPITWVLESNGKSVCTPTNDVWYNDPGTSGELWDTKQYVYDLPWPHAGAGKRVQF